MSAARLKARLEAMGHLVLPLLTENLASYIESRSARDADVVHAIHLSRTFDALSREQRSSFPRPLILTQAGTDLGDLAKDGEEYEEFLRAARFVVTHLATTRAALLSRYASLDPQRVVVIDKGIELPGDAPLPEDFARALAGKVVIGLVAHLRRVKDVGLGVQGFRRLRASLPQPLAEKLLLVILGEELEQDYARSLSLDLEPQVLHRALRRDEMRRFYESCTFVLNTSLVEGAPNAFLEALSLGRIVVGPEIDGLRGIHGLALARGAHGADSPVRLYERNPEALFVVMRDVLADEVARPRREAAARASFGQGYGTEREASAHRDLYAIAARERH